MSNKYRFGTKAIHAGVEPDPSTGAIMTPVFQSSTYVQEAVGKHKGYQYSRSQNPTRSALEKNIAALENAAYAAIFASGMAATDCLLRTLKPGDEVIATNDLYGGTYRIFKTVFEPLGIKFHFTSFSEPEKIRPLISEQTKLIWLESPSNPMLSIVDIKAIASIKSGKNILLGVDNTFATPFLQNPLDLGADVVMHSVTKYLAGHSDVVMGALATNHGELASEINRIRNSTGAICGPQDAFLVLRGIKTLHLRMRQHCDNARSIASWLDAHKKVAKVYWPGLEDHPNHQIAKSQMRGFGGMISFSLVGDREDDAKTVLNALKIFSLAESLGGVESLAGHPATMTHAAIPREERIKAGVTDSLVRLSVGVEDVEDLVEDLDQALARI